MFDQQIFDAGDFLVQGTGGDDPQCRRNSDRGFCLQCFIVRETEQGERSRGLVGLILASITASLVFCTSPTS